MATQVTVIGDATLDVRAVPLVPMRPGGDVPATVTLGPGGQGANVAVRLARRGVRTRLVCRIGDDAAGALVRAAITGDGVEVVDLGAPFTGTVVVLLDAVGDRTMLSQRLALLEGRPPSASLFEADWLVVSGYVLLERNSGISTAGGSMRRVVAGCSLDPASAGDWADAARSLHPQLVVLNADEARVLVADGDPSELSRRVGAATGAVVVVTEASGATAVLGDRVVRADAEPGAASLDTTGAGDAFTAGLVAELLEQPWPPSAEQLSTALQAAGELAAAVTRTAGAQGRVAGEA